MAEYKAKSTETLVFTLTKNSNLIGKLTYKNWLSFKSTISLTEGSSFQITPKGFWQTEIDIENDSNTVVVKMKMNWDNENVRLTSFLGKEQNLLFKNTGNLKKTSFALKDENDQNLLTINFDENWNTENYEYNIETNNDFENLVDKEILIMSSIYLMNSFITSTETLLTTAII